MRKSGSRTDLQWRPYTYPSAKHPAPTRIGWKSVQVENPCDIQLNCQSNMRFHSMELSRVLVAVLVAAAWKKRDDANGCRSQQSSVGMTHFLARVKIV